MRRRALERGPLSPFGMAHLQHGVRLSVRCCGVCPWIYSLNSDITITLLLDFLLKQSGIVRQKGEEFSPDALK